MAVSPGDQILASIQLVNGTSNQWTMNMNDTTSDTSFQGTFNYSSSQLSAEWIVERPTVNGSLRALADFGNVTFTSCYASVGSITGVINSFPWNAVAIYSSATSPPTQLTDVSELTSDGGGFTVTYLPSG